MENTNVLTIKGELNMKKEKHACRAIGLVIVMASVLLFSGCGGVFFPLPYRSLAPFEGRVVDTETKEPIEGAVVLAVYYFTFAGIAGSDSYVGDGQEIGLAVDRGADQGRRHGIEGIDRSDGLHGISSPLFSIDRFPDRNPRVRDRRWEMWPKSPPAAADKPPDRPPARCRPHAPVRKR